MYMQPPTPGDPKNLVAAAISVCKEMMKAPTERDELANIYSQFRTNLAISEGHPVAKAQNKNSQQANTSKLRVFAKLGMRSKFLNTNKADPKQIVDAADLLTRTRDIHIGLLRGVNKTKLKTKSTYGRF